MCGYRQHDRDVPNGHPIATEGFAPLRRPFSFLSRHKTEPVCPMWEVHHDYFRCSPTTIPMPLSRESPSLGLIALSLEATSAGGNGPLLQGNIFRQWPTVAARRRLICSKGRLTVAAPRQTTQRPWDENGEPRRHIDLYKTTVAEQSETSSKSADHLLVGTPPAGRGADESHRRPTEPNDPIELPDRLSGLLL